MVRYLHRYGLAIACVAAPFLFGVWASSLTVAWLLAPSHVERIKLDYRFRDQPAATPSDSAARPGQTPEPGRTVPPASKGDATADGAPRFQLVAQHFAGVVTYALGSGFLYFVCAVALALSAMTIVRRVGPKSLALAIGGFAIVSVAEAYLVMQDKPRRILVTDNIFQLADRHDLLKDMPVADRMVDLLAANIFVGLFTSGILLTALAVASIRRGAAVDRPDLEDRLLVIRAALCLASAILVADTLLARALVDWPISLLVDAERKALDPIGDAITRLWAVSSSIALLAAFLPAIAAWYLDRKIYRATQSPGDPAHRIDDGLDIAPASAVTGIVVVLAPVVASPLVDALKSLLTVVGGR
jgi:hypothetical protein